MIGFADAVSFMVAAISAPVMGILADKWRGEILCVLGCILQALSCIFTALYYAEHTNIYVVFVFLILQGLGLAMFWSPDETLIGKESYIGDENRNISYFAMLSAFGKAVGFLLGGSLTVIVGNTYSLFLGAALPMTVFLIYPRIQTFKNDQKNPNGKEDQNAPKKKYPSVFYFTSLIVHLFAYGVIAIISSQYVGFATDEQIILNGVSETTSVFVGVFLFVVNIVQTITFVVLGRWKNWQYKHRYNIIAMITLLCVAVGLNKFRNGWLVMILSLPMGIVAGYEYQANLFYSITLSHDHGKYLGISEFIGELTYSLSPLGCGVLMTKYGQSYINYMNIFMCFAGIFITSVIGAYYKLADKKTDGSFDKLSAVEMDEENDELETQEDDSNKAIEKNQTNETMNHIDSLDTNEAIEMENQINTQQLEKVLSLENDVKDIKDNETHDSNVENNNEIDIKSNEINNTVTNEINTNDNYQPKRVTSPPVISHQPQSNISIETDNDENDFIVTDDNYNDTAVIIDEEILY